MRTTLSAAAALQVLLLSCSFPVATLAAANSAEESVSDDVLVVDFSTVAVLDIPREQAIMIPGVAMCPRFDQALVLANDLFNAIFAEVNFADEDAEKLAQASGCQILERQHLLMHDVTLQDGITTGGIPWHIGVLLVSRGIESGYVIYPIF